MHLAVAKGNAVVLLKSNGDHDQHGNNHPFTSLLIVDLTYTYDHDQFLSSNGGPYCPHHSSKDFRTKLQYPILFSS